MTPDDHDGGPWLHVRLYSSDGRIEELKEALEVTTHPEIARRTEDQHLHFIFTGLVDADGFAVYQQTNLVPDNHVRNRPKDHMSAGLW